MSRFLFSGCACLCALGTATTAIAQRASASQPSPTLPTIAPAPEPRRIVRVAIPDMSATVASDAELAKTLTQVLTLEVNKVRGIEAIGMADIEALLNHEQQKALLGCEQASCIAEIGGALGVDALLTSNIGRVGDTIVLSIQLNDTHAARKIGGAYETVAGKPDALIAVIQRKVPEVMRNAQPAWALEPVAAAPPPRSPRDGIVVRTGTSEQILPFHPVWPAIGVAVGGGLALVGAGVLVGLGVAFRGAASEYQSAELGKYEYWAAGAQEPFDTSKALAWGGLALLGIGSLAVLGGVTWQILEGFSADGGAR